MFWEAMLANLVGGAAVAGIFLLISLVMASTRERRIRSSLDRSIEIALNDITTIAAACQSDPIIAQALHGPYSTLHSVLNLHDVKSGLTGLEGYLGRLRVAIAGVQAAAAILVADTTGAARALRHPEGYIESLKTSLDGKASALGAEAEKLKGLLNND